MLPPCTSSHTFPHFPPRLQMPPGARWAVVASSHLPEAELPQDLLSFFKPDGGGGRGGGGQETRAEAEGVQIPGKVRKEASPSVSGASCQGGVVRCPCASPAVEGSSQAGGCALDPARSKSREVAMARAADWVEDRYLTSRRGEGASGRVRSRHRGRPERTVSAPGPLSGESAVGGDGAEGGGAGDRPQQEQGEISGRPPLQQPPQHHLQQPLHQPLKQQLEDQRSGPSRPEPCLQQQAIVRCVAAALLSHPAIKAARVAVPTRRSLGGGAAFARGRIIKGAASPPQGWGWELTQQRYYESDVVNKGFRVWSVQRVAQRALAGEIALVDDLVSELRAACAGVAAAAAASSGTAIAPPRSKANAFGMAAAAAVVSGGGSNGLQLLPVQTSLAARRAAHAACVLLDFAEDLCLGSACSPALHGGPR